MEEQGTAAKTALVVDTRETGQLTVDTSDEGRGIRIELVITTNINVNGLKCSVVE